MVILIVPVRSQIYTSYVLFSDANKSIFERPSVHVDAVTAPATGLPALSI